MSLKFAALGSLTILSALGTSARADDQELPSLFPDTDQYEPRIPKTGKRNTSSVVGKTTTLGATTIQVAQAAAREEAMQSKIIATSVVLFGLLAASAFGVFIGGAAPKAGTDPYGTPIVFRPQMNAESTLSSLEGSAPAKTCTPLPVLRYLLRIKAALGRS